jgi:uncharacterized glyoxalase superfamily protein PhnB
VIPSLSQIHSTVPVICTDDIRGSISYYVNVLGFSPDFEFGDPIVYAGVKSGEAEIYFTYDPDSIKLMKEKKIHPEIFIWLSDAEVWFKAHVAKGAEIVEPISDRPWGARQYVIREINGYHLKFAQPV